MKKINLESIILEAYGCKDVSEFQRENDISIQMTKEIMLEFGKQLLELANENAKLIDIKRMNCQDHTPYWGECQCCGQYDNYEIVIGQNLDKESITNTIKQAE